jgi:hypothetical protein
VTDEDRDRGQTHLPAEIGYVLFGEGRLRRKGLGYAVEREGDETRHGGDVMKIVEWNSTWDVRFARVYALYLGVI